MTTVPQFEKEREKLHEEAAALKQARIERERKASGPQVNPESLRSWRRVLTTKQIEKIGDMWDGAESIEDIIAYIDSCLHKAHTKRGKLRHDC